MAALILSYPGPTFSPDDAVGDDISSVSARLAMQRSAHAAMGQWLELCDHLTRAGGNLLIIDPPRVASPSAVSAVYSGRLGAEFRTSGTLNTPIFLRSRGESVQSTAATPAAATPAAATPTAATPATATNSATPATSPVTDFASRAITRAGLQVRQSTHRFQGELDVISIDRNRYILTHGQSPQSTSRAALDEVRPLLPLGAQTLEIELRPPFTAGRQGIAYLTTPGGSKVLLSHRGALLSHTPEDLARFAGNQVECFVLSPEDAAAHVTQCVLVSGTLIMEFGCSTILRGQLARRGFQIVQTAVDLLFGTEKGGPRPLVCELPGLVLGEDAPSYALRRDELVERRASYNAGI